MGRRYSRILQASYLNQAVDNYVQYIQQASTRTRNIGGGTAKPPQVDLAIEPFNIDVASGEKWLARVGQPSRAQLGTGVGTAVQEVGGSVDAIKVAGFQPARISVFIGSGSSTVATSKITGLRYLKYNGTNYSHPFGRVASTDREQEIFNNVKAALAGANRRFSLRSERIKQN